MGQTNPLRLMFHGESIDNGMLERLHNGLMDGIALSTLWSATRTPLTWEVRFNSQNLRQCMHFA